MTRLRIGIVAVNVRRASSGSNEAYLRGLLSGLASLRLPNVEIDVYCADRELVAEALGPDHGQVTIHETPLPAGKLAAYGARLLHEARIALFSGVDVLLFAATSIPPVARCPLVAVVHWDSKLQPASSPPMQAKFNSLVLTLLRRRGTFVVVPTAAYGRHLERNWDLDGKKILPVHHGVSLPAHLTGATRTAGSAISIINDLPHKNLPILMTAWARISVRRPDARLTLVGRVGDDALDATGVDWRSLVAAGSLVRSHWLDHDEVMQKLASSEVLISPSHGETFCLPLAEAMSVGTPVIAADTEVAREVCDRAALYYEVQDPSALVEKVMSVFFEKQLAEALSKTGLERSTLYTWEKTAKKTIELLETVARRSQAKEQLTWQS